MAILREIVAIGNLANQKDLRILDFGCGFGELKKILGANRVVGYDIIPELSDVLDWRSVEFDVIVANEVFYCFNSDALNSLLLELKNHNPELMLIVGISKQGVLNNIGKYILFRPNAHSATKISPSQELEILLGHCTIVKHVSLFFLVDIFLLKFKIDSGDVV